MPAVMSLKIEFCITIAVASKCLLEHGGSHMSGDSTVTEALGLQLDHRCCLSALSALVYTHNFLLLGVPIGKSPLSVQTPLHCCVCSAIRPS